MRDPKYLAWLREHKCVACQLATHPVIRNLREPSEAAHGPINGTGSKGPDDQAIPLCAYHHRHSPISMHRVGWSRFEEIHEFSRENEAAAHRAAYQIDKENDEA